MSHIVQHCELKRQEKGAPFFSIVVPVYNVAKFLPACLASVVAQRFEDWECVCVDDGSSDGSGAILDAFAARDGRFRVFHQRNQGVSAARNLALQHVRGAYVTFVDGDDLILPSWLERAAAAIKEHQPEVVRQRLQVAYPDGSTVRFEVDPPTLYTERSELLRWGIKMFIHRGYMPLLFIKRSLLAGLSFARGLSLKEDCIFNFYLLMRLSSLFQSEEDGYRYRLRADSTVNGQHTAAMFLQFIDAALAFYDAHAATFVEHGAGDTLQEALGTLLSQDVVEAAAASVGEPRWAAWRKVRAVHTRLQVAGLLRLSRIHVHWRLAYAMYRFTSMLWPLRLLKALTRLRRI